MAEQQKIHPVDLEAPPPSAPLVPRDYSRSDKPDPHPHRSLPVSHLSPPKKRRGCCCKCLCWTVLVVVLLAVLVAATVGALYLILDPKVPTYTVDRLRVSEFSIDTSLTARTTISVTVTADNPNKAIGIYYLDGSRLSADYEGSELCAGELPEFYQGHRNTTVMTVVMKGEVGLGDGLAEGLQQKVVEGSVPLGVRGDVPVKLKLGGLKLWKMTVEVGCDLVVDSLSVNNLINIKTSSCELKKFHLF